MSISDSYKSRMIAHFKSDSVRDGDWQLLGEVFLVSTMSGVFGTDDLRPQLLELNKRVNIKE